RALSPFILLPYTTLFRSVKTLDDRVVHIQVVAAVVVGDPVVVTVLATEKRGPRRAALRVVVDQVALPPVPMGVAGEIRHGLRGRSEERRVGTARRWWREE